MGCVSRSGGVVLVRCREGGRVCLLSFMDLCIGLGSCRRSFSDDDDSRSSWHRFRLGAIWAVFVPQRHV